MGTHHLSNDHTNIIIQPMMMNQQNKVPSTWGPGGLISFKGRGGLFQGNCQFFLRSEGQVQGSRMGMGGVQRGERYSSQSSKNKGRE